MSERAEQERVLPVDVGMAVEVELVAEDGSVEAMSFTVVADSAAAFEEGLLAASAPLVRALRGRPAGSVVPVQMGELRAVRVRRVAPAGAHTSEAAERARAAVDDALRKVERTNAEIFAATFTSKWGGYDAERMQD